ncbi:MAG: hypothetical protein V5A84_04510 [Planctomycetota bacterium]
MNRNHTTAILAILMLVSAALPRAATREQDHLLDDMPASVTTTISAPDYPALGERLGRLPFGDGEAPSAPFLGAARDALDPRLKDFFSEADISLERLDGLPTGPVALGLALADEGNPRLRGLLLVDVAESREAARSVLKDARRAADTLDWLEVESRELRGRTVDCFTVSGGRPEGPTPRRFYALLHSGTLAVAGGSEGRLMETYITLRRSGDADSVADSELYRRAMKYLEERGDVMFFSASDRSVGIGAPRARWLRRMGLQDVRSSARAIRFNEEGVHTRSVHLIPAPRRGLMKALSTGEAHPEPPAFVGEDPVFYGSLRFDAATLWSEALAALEELSAESARKVRKRVESGRLPFDLQKDVLDALGSNWQLYVPNPAVGSGMPRMVHAGLAVELKDVDGPRRALELWLQPGGGNRTYTKMTHAGATIYSVSQKVPLAMLPVSLPSPEEDGQSGSGQPMTAIRPSLVLLEDRAVLTSSRELARKIAERSSRQSSPLMDRRQVREMLSRLMPERDGLVVADARRVGRATWGYARKLARRHSSGEVRLPPFSEMQR